MNKITSYRYIRNGVTYKWTQVLQVHTKRSTWFSEKWINTTSQIIVKYCHVIAHGDEEVRLLLLLVFELTVSSRQKKWPLRKNVGHRGDKQMLVLSDPRSPDIGRGKREKPNDWLGPQNGSGAPFPSAEVKDKKFSFWARLVADEP